MAVHVLSIGRSLAFNQSNIVFQLVRPSRDVAYPRIVENRVRNALDDTRVVMLSGPRQAGKTTLARQIAGDDRPFVTLDDPTVLSAASSDPVGFVRNLDRAVIDEVQRAPNLILAIKLAVDTRSFPGRFLLTGSANLMVLPQVADSLAGRMAILRLLPLAQAEIRRRGCTFLDSVFAGEFPEGAHRSWAMNSGNWSWRGGIRRS